MGTFGEPDWTHRGFSRFDFASFCAYVGLFLLVRSVLLKFVFRPLAWWLMIPSEHRIEDEKNRKTVAKVTKYMWHGIVYIVLWIWALRLLSLQPWAYSVDAIWSGYPHASVVEKQAVRQYILIQASWYGHGLIESLLVDAGRGDFWMLIAHHVLAVCMLGGAYWSNAHRCAVSVCAEQDLSDIILYLSKITKECRRFPLAQRSWVTSISAVLIWLSWLCTRIVILGWIVVTAYQFHIRSGIIVPGHPNCDWLSIYLVAQLSVFLAMQLVWWLGICWMTWTQVTKGFFQDIWHDERKQKKN